MSTYGFFILVYISIGYPSVSRGGVPLDDLVRGHSGTPPGQRERGETWVWLPGSQTRLVPISVSHLCQQSCPQVSVRYGVWGVVCGVVSSVSWGIVKRYCGPFYMECIHALKFCLILFILNCLLSLLKLEAICCSWYSLVCLCVTTLSCYLPPTYDTQSQGQRERKPCPGHEWGGGALQDGGQLSGAAHRADGPLLHVVRFWVHHSC